MHVEYRLIPEAVGAVAPEDVHVRVVTVRRGWPTSTYLLVARAGSADVFYLDPAGRSVKAERRVRVHPSRTIEDVEISAARYEAHLRRAITTGAVVAFLVDAVTVSDTEDEQKARRAAEDGRTVWTEQSSGVIETGPWPDGVHALGDSRITRFMEAFDPARVLAECAAKRRILAFARFADKIAADPQVDPVYRMGQAHGAHVVVAALAATYSDHPDYQEAWDLL